MTNLNRLCGYYCLYFVGGAISTLGCSGSDAVSNGVGSGGMTLAAPGGGPAVGGSNGVGGSQTTTLGTGGSTSTSSNPFGGANASGGVPQNGGTSSGGANAAGGSQSTGGKSAGGAVAIGGTPAGGSVTGGKSAGGNSAGGGSRGGTSAVGGASTGGAAKGGAATGGAATGGAATGGAATGGAATGGAATSSGGGSSCSTPPDPSPLVGWAAVSGNGVTTTTGGGNATPTTVTTLAALQTAAKGTNAAVIYVSGKLASGNITVGSNKTIVGLCGAEIHGHIEMSGSVNVIIRNIKIVGYGVGNCALDPSYTSAEGCSSGADAISLQKNSHHVWFDHCDISDGTDGNLDITNQADYVTVSWTKFHYTARTDNTGSDSTGASGHRYSNLVGGSDSSPDAGTLNITWHHCWWGENVHERQPQVRFGKNHLFNNLWTSSGNNYCVRAVIDAHILIESSVFSGVKDPHLFNGSASSTSNITAGSTNTYTNTTGSKITGGSGTAFTTPPYSYTPDATSSVQAAVQSGAGPH